MIVYYNNPKLRYKSASIPEITDDVENTAMDLLQQQKSTNAVGLAAPQIGKNIRMFVIGKDIFINPTIINHSSELVSSPEGCISLPKVQVLVNRFKDIEVSYTDIDSNEKHGALYGQEAIIFQHELDHLNGILIIDHVSSVQKLRLKNILNYIDKKFNKL